VALSESLLRGTRVVSESVYARSIGETATIVHHLYAGDRSRSESVHPVAAGFAIERRDLRQRIRVLVGERKYQIMPLFDVATEEEKARFRHSGRHWRKRHDSLIGSATRQLKIDFSYQATGEEQSMFGCTARHWIVRRRDEHDSKYGGNWTEAITEAWYLDSEDVAARFSGFSADLVHHAICYATSRNERAIIEHSGKKPSGLCAWSETKSLAHIELPNAEIREQTENSSVRILSIAEESFPVSLFEPPKEFHKIPVYPDWITLARLDFARLFQRHSRNSA
jgi:hypothetical protein